MVEVHPRTRKRILRKAAKYLFNSDSTIDHMGLCAALIGVVPVNWENSKYYSMQAGLIRLYKDCPKNPYSRCLYWMGSSHKNAYPFNGNSLKHNFNRRLFALLLAAEVDDETFYH